MYPLMKPSRGSVDRRVVSNQAQRQSSRVSLMKLSAPRLVQHRLAVSDTIVLAFWNDDVILSLRVGDRPHDSVGDLYARELDCETH